MSNEKKIEIDDGPLAFVRLTIVSAFIIDQFGTEMLEQLYDIADSSTIKETTIADATEAVGEHNA